MKKMKNKENKKKKVKKKKKKNKKLNGILKNFVKKATEFKFIIETNNVVDKFTIIKNGFPYVLKNHSEISFHINNLRVKR